MKQTIEEAAKEYILKKYEGTYSMAITSFKAGAKWQAEQSPWVSVKEHLPDEQEMVLCMMKSNNAIVSGYIVTPSNHKPTVLTAPDFEFEDLMDYEPIAWMPMPDREEG